MPKDELYQKIIDDFKITGSLKKTAENLGTTLVRAQRVLITEGLWSSPTSEKIWSLCKTGMDVKAIAAELCITEKTVQAYLPYTKGYYSETVKSNDAIRSGEYRGRKQSAAKNRVHYVQNEKKKREVKYYTDLKNGLRPMDIPEMYVKKSPSVLKLHLELVLDDIDESGWSILRRYGRVTNGISRDVLVSSDMTLHALHYAIQRAFGWQNSHLHHYSLCTEDFNLLTCGTREYDARKSLFDQYDGSIMKWAQLCGTYFRFPTDDFDDLYWDDDYDGKMSIRNWLKSKYTGNSIYGGDCEHFVNARSAAIHFLENKGIEKNDRAIGEICEKTGLILTELLERLHLGEVLFPIGSQPLNEAVLDEQNELRSALYERMVKKYTEAGIPKPVKKITSFEDIPWSEDDVRVKPVTRKLMYNYDYGDGWEVRITCTDGYYINDRYDDNPDGFVVAVLDDKKAIEEMRVYDHQDKRIAGDDATRIALVHAYEKPCCIELDGLPVMDDVGGTSGYIDFLNTINDGNADNHEDLRLWAQSMGWSGRSPKCLVAL